MIFFKENNNNLDMVVCTYNPALGGGDRQLPGAHRTVSLACLALEQLETLPQKLRMTTKFVG